MSEQTEVIHLVNPTGNERITQVLFYTGAIVHRITDDEDEGYVRYEFPDENIGEEWLAISDYADNLNSVTGAHNVGDDLRLIVTCDDGMYEYSMLGKIGHYANDNPDIHVVRKMRWL